MRTPTKGSDVGFLRLTVWDIPAWVLLPQLFLAAGWARAGIENAIDGDWWTGETLRRFIEMNAVHGVPIYEPFASHVVQPLAAPIAALVCATELAVAVMLALNYRVVGAVIVGSFLNVHFMLAGSVNPSTFYIVIGMVIIVWHLERRCSMAARRTYARRTRRAAAAAFLGLAPFVTTIHPARVIEDPAIVLIFLSALTALAIEWSHRSAQAEGF